MQKAKFVNISAGKIFYLMFSLLIFALQSVSLFYAFTSSAIKLKFAASTQILQMCRKCSNRPYCSVQVQLNPS